MVHKLQLPLWKGVFPPGEKPELHYVTMTNIKGEVMLVQQLINARARALADVEDTKWGVIGDTRVVHTGIRSVGQWEDYILWFPKHVLGPNVGIVVPDSIYFRGEASKEDSLSTDEEEQAGEDKDHEKNKEDIDFKATE